MNASTKRSPNRRPTHPGGILREDVLPALTMTQTEFADLWEVAQQPAKLAAVKPLSASRLADLAAA